MKRRMTIRVIIRTTITMMSLMENHRIVEPTLCYVCKDQTWKKFLAFWASELGNQKPSAILQSL
jgi:hypothetical protein